MDAPKMFFAPKTSRQIARKRYGVEIAAGPDGDSDYHAKEK
jgi:hypothetical protein